MAESAIPLRLQRTANPSHEKLSIEQIYECISGKIPAYHVCAAWLADYEKNYQKYPYAFLVATNRFFAEAGIDLEYAISDYSVQSPHLASESTFPTLHCLCWADELRDNYITNPLACATAVYFFLVELDLDIAVRVAGRKTQFPAKIRAPSRKSRIMAWLDQVQLNEGSGDSSSSASSSQSSSPLLGPLTGQRGRMLMERILNPNPPRGIFDISSDEDAESD
jgi:hypothetical protein